MTTNPPSNVFAWPSRRIPNSVNPAKSITASRNLSTLREMAIGLLRAHPSKKTLPLKPQQATLDLDFKLRLLANFQT